MADFSNLIPGDEVDWIRKLRLSDELVRAVVWGKTAQKVIIRFHHKGLILTKYVDAADLRLIHGGKKRLEREVMKFKKSLLAQPTKLATPPPELLNA